MSFNSSKSENSFADVPVLGLGGIVLDPTPYSYNSHSTDHVSTINDYVVNINFFPIPYP